MSNENKIRPLTREELEKLNTNKSLIKIKIDFGDQLDMGKEISYKEYADFLEAMCVHYKGSAIEELLQLMQKSSSLKHEMFGNKVQIPQTEFTMSNCSGCGCGWPADWQQFDYMCAPCRQS